MARFYSDPDEDEDDIKRILESMWEKTSRSESDGPARLGRGRAIEIDLEFESSARGSGSPRADNVAITDCEPLQNGIEHDWPHGGNAEVPHRRLIDALHDVVVSEQNGLEHSSSMRAPDGRAQPMRDDHQQLSSLSYQGDGRVMAASDPDMQSQSEHSPHNPLGYANGRSHDGPGGDHEPAIETPNPAGPATVGRDGAGIKREMASFFDSRMKGMGGGPAAPEGARVPVNSPVPQRPSAVTDSRDAGLAPVYASPIVQSEPVPQQSAVSPSVSSVSTDSAAELMRPVLRQWLGENMPKIVESALQIEAAESAVSGDTKKPDK